jgi:phosphatidylserine/phosphatidylglycerophosphate/cardiolipin synthase-like enzyme
VEVVIKKWMLMLSIFASTLYLEGKSRAFFTPFHDVKKERLALINQETKHIAFTMYYLTDKFIVDALKGAHNRGVYIEAIIDQDSFNTANNGKAEELVKAGMHILKFETAGMFRPLMHNKFFIFSSTRFHEHEDYISLVWTGSYNCTARASKNCENVIITDEQEIIEQYKTAFVQLQVLIESGIYSKGVLAEELYP